ncbi:hypothetical protein [Nodosilinea sp. LEGE 06152]|nr:hypothetical protein [Nodosilinea sp. LEGE 06152]
MERSAHSYGKKLVDYESLGIAEDWIVDCLSLRGRRYPGSIPIGR